MLPLLHHASILAVLPVRLFLPLSLFQVFHRVSKKLNCSLQQWLMDLFCSISQIQYKDESIYDAKKVQSMPVVPVFFLMNGKPMECILRKQIQVCIFLRQSYLYWLLCLSVFSYVLCRCWAPIAPLETYYFVVKERTNIVCMVIRYYMHYKMNYKKLWYICERNTIS